MRRPAFALALLLLPALASAAEPLNLLILTADDMNADSSGWMGSRLGATPNLDAFAGTCSRFVQCHVSAPICQPSRSALMTGRVPHRNGALGFNPIRLDVPTLPEVLQAKGYFTAAVNKVEHMAPEKKFPWDLRLNGSGKNPKAFRAHVEAALKAARDQGRPFFLNANITDPHRPFPNVDADGNLAPPAAGKAKAKQRQAGANEHLARVYKPAEVVVPSFLEDIPRVRQEVAQYFTSVARFDVSFGAALAALKEAGAEDRTVVVFLSDHGMSFPYSKATLYRNGTWSPLLIRWPGMGKPVVNADDFVSSVDVLPTVLDLLGVDQPAGVDGRSLVPLLRGEKQADRDHVFTHVNTVSSGKAFPGRCARSKARSYLWNAWPDGKTAYRVEAMGGLTFNALSEAGKGDPRIQARVRHFLYRTAEELYDLEKDPDERRNLAADPAYRDELTRLRGLLEKHMEQTADPLLNDFRKLARTEIKGGTP